MTECNGQRPLFSSLGRRQVQADFAGGTRTSDAGGCLLRGFDRRCGWIDALAAGLTDRRDPSRITRDLRTMRAQRIYGLALGYKDLNDRTTLRQDPLFAVLADQRPDPQRPLASAPTPCRLENGETRASPGRMAAVLKALLKNAGARLESGGFAGRRVPRSRRRVVGVLVGASEQVEA